VPFYDVIQDTVAELSDWLAPDTSTLVDLGVSTGETFARITQRHPDRSLALIGYDTSEEMLTAAKVKVPGLCGYQRSIEDGLTHHEAQLTLSLFTLQFLPPRHRVNVLRMAHNLTTPEGALLIAEKVREPDARWFEIGAELSWDKKAEAGIPSESIRSKARALRGVLQPNTLRGNLDMITEAGWQGATCLFKWHQWCLFGAFAS
jgi:tRNA (cmo5U34)-methyltransferase